MYIKVENGVPVKWPYSLSQLRKENKNVSFPANPPAALLAEYGVYTLVDLAAPAVNHTQRVARKTPELVGNDWTWGWEISPASQDEIDIAVAAQIEIVKAERDRRLSESDFTQLPDSAKNRPAWAQYRNTLRDLLNNLPDPFNPVWPEKPEPLDRGPVVTTPANNP